MNKIKNKNSVKQSHHKDPEPRCVARIKSGAFYKFLLEVSTFIHWPDPGSLATVGFKTGDAEHGAFQPAEWKKSRQRGMENGF